MNENTKPRMTFSELRGVINPVSEAFNKYGIPVLTRAYPNIRMHPEERLLAMCAVDWLNCFVRVVKGQEDP